MSTPFSDCAFNSALVHQAVVAWLAGGRQGTQAQKGRGAVRGGGRKPWRQKGTGRARAGSIRSPLWRGGGVTFAASPRDHSVQLNRKMFRSALRSIIAERGRRDDIQTVDALQVAEPKTRLVAQMLRDLGIGGRALLVLAEPDEALALASRNLHQVELLQYRQLNPVSLLAADHIVMTAPALKAVEQWLA